MFINGQWNSLQFQQFGFSYSFSSFYTMTVSITDQTLWTVSMDETVLMTVSDATGITDRLSGKIGIRNVNSTLEVASYFVSGSTVFTDDNSLYFVCNDITTSSPTADPSGSPTPSPTGNPTPAPTPRPTTRDEAGGPSPSAPTQPIVTPSPIRPTVANNPNTPNLPLPTPPPSFLPIPGPGGADTPNNGPSGQPPIPQPPSWTAKPTTSAPTAGVGGLGPNSNELGEAVPATAISEETMVWLIGIPAGAIMICLVASCVVNLYFCKKEFIEPEDEEGEYDDEYGDGYGDVYEDEMMYRDDDSSVTEDRMNMVMDEEDLRDMHQYPKSF